MVEHVQEQEEEQKEEQKEGYLGRKFFEIFSIINLVLCYNRYFIAPCFQGCDRESVCQCVFGGY